MGFGGRMIDIYLVYDESDNSLPEAIFTTVELAESYVDAQPDKETFFIVPFAVHEAPISQLSDEDFKSGWDNEVENQNSLLARAEAFIRFASPDKTTAEIMRDFVIYELRRLLGDLNANTEESKERRSN